MIALKLVRLIESHSEELAHSLMSKIEKSSKCADLKKFVPPLEMQSRVHEVYRNLSEWLITKTEHDIFLTYTALGKHRFQQGVPFHDFVWGLLLTKENLWDFLQRELVDETPLQLRSEFEFLRLLDQFYERAIYYAALGYWEAHEFAEREEHMAHAHA